MNEYLSSACFDNITSEEDCLAQLREEWAEEQHKQLKFKVIPIGDLNALNTLKQHETLKSIKIHEVAAVRAKKVFEEGMRNQILAEKYLKVVNKIASVLFKIHNFFLS